MTEQVEQRICIKFCMKLEHSSVEAIWMIQKATAMGKLRIGSFITTTCLLMYYISVKSFLVKQQITKVTQPSNSPDLASCDLWLFPKLKSPLKGKRFQKRWQSSWWHLRELCEVPRCLLWRGLRHHCPMYSVSCIFFSKCLYFSYYMAGYLLDRPLSN